MKSFLKGLVFGVTVLTLFVAPALAEAPGWRYVEGGFLSVDEDDLSDSGDNYFVGGAFGFKSFHVIGFWSNGELGTDVDLEYWRIGFGWHGGLSEKADIVAEAYYVDQELDFDSSGVEDDSGYRVTGGIRWVPIKFFEADGFANWADVTDDSDLSWEARGIFNIWRLGFGASYEWLENAEQWNVFVRFNFDKG